MPKGHDAQPAPDAEITVQPEDISALAAEQAVEIANLKARVFALRRQNRELRAAQAKRPNEQANETLQHESLEPVTEREKIKADAD